MEFVMMALAATFTKAATVVTAIGTVGSGALYLDSRHAPMTVVGDLAILQLFDLVEQAQRDGSAEWICNAIEKEVIRLCSQQPDHYLCDEDRVAVNDLKRRAGCGT